jgi:ADP-ribose pyrophosphatase
MNVVVDEIELPDKKHSKREIVRHSGGAAMLLVQNDKVLLVRQYRYAYGKAIYEIPAGKLNKGEDPKLAAERELEEETGYHSTETVHLNDIYPSPGYTDEVIHVYYAKNYTFCGSHLDEGEFLNAEFIELEKVLAMIESGEICDSKTVIAIYNYLLKYRKQS